MSKPEGLTAISKEDIARAQDDLAFLSSIEEIIDDARNGRMFVLIDDEGRENEGDLVIPAQMATPDAINFMATYGRGLICLALTRERVDQLKLPLLPQTNASRLQTAFAVSIEASEGVTTGISAPDRARTVAYAIDPTKGPDDIVTPGHVFPLAARDGGVLVRAGHTEAGVDLARLAGLNPSAVICEIMNEDGTMARLPDLIAFRRHHDRIVERLSESTLTSRFGGDFRMFVYVNTVEYAEHIALVKGEVAPDRLTLVRMHALDVLGDVLGDTRGGAGTLHAAMRAIEDAGGGVVVLIREPRPTSLSDRVRAEGGGATRELRDYGVGAQILLDLGVRDMVLLSNSQRSIVGLEGFGLRVVDRRPIQPEESDL